MYCYVIWKPQNTDHADLFIFRNGSCSTMFQHLVSLCDQRNKFAADATVSQTVLSPLNYLPSRSTGEDAASYPKPVTYHKPTHTHTHKSGSTSGILTKQPRVCVWVCARVCMMDGGMGCYQGEHVSMSATFTHRLTGQWHTGTWAAVT